MKQFINLPVRDFLKEVDQSSYTSNVLDIIEGLLTIGVNFNMEVGPWIAGGCLEALATGQNLNRRDIDIFYPSRVTPRVNLTGHTGLFDDNWEIKRNGVEFNNTFWEKTISENSETRRAVLNRTRIDLQAIKHKTYKSPYSVLGDFDFTVCQLITDGENIITTPQTVEDIKTSTLRITRMKQDTNTLQRIAKYTMEYGYTFAPGELQRIHEIVKGREDKFSRNSNS